jgi:hypothetical protein
MHLILFQTSTHAKWQAHLRLYQHKEMAEAAATSKGRQGVWLRSHIVTIELPD